MTHRLSLMLASTFHIGFIPGAPGTYASLATVAVLVFLRPAGGSFNPLLLLAAVSLITLAGIITSNVVSRKAGDEDPSYVVIDEVAGQLLTFLCVPLSIPNLVLGFIAFRTFDIWKPWPIRRLEPLPHGIGIMADDLLAGVYGCVVVHLINMFLRSMGWV